MMGHDILSMVCHVTLWYVMCYVLCVALLHQTVIHGTTLHRFRLLWLLLHSIVCYCVTLYCVAPCCIIMSYITLQYNTIVYVSSELAIPHDQRLISNIASMICLQLVRNLSLIFHELVDNHPTNSR